MALLNSLKRAFTVSYLLVASVPVLLFGLICIQLVSEHLLKRAHDENVKLTYSLVNEVDTFLNEVRSDLLHVQHIIDSEGIMPTGNLDRFLNSVVTNSQFFESIYYLDKNYHITNLGLMEALEARRSDYVDLDYSALRVFREMTPENNAVWSNTFTSLITGEPSVTLGLTTQHGFLLGNIRLNSLGLLLEGEKVYGESEAAIIDLNGSLIAHSIREMPLVKSNFNNHPVVSKAMAGSEATDEFRDGAKLYLESAARINMTDWVVWVGFDMAKIQAPINAIRDVLIGFMIVTAFLTSLLSLANIRRLMRPLTVLGEKTGMIADGRYDFDFHTSGFVEIDQLADQFASMSKAIKVREESIISNEKRFRNLVNSIDGIVWEMDYPSFRFLFVSEQAEVILNYQLQEWYEDPLFWEHKLHDDDREQTRAYCRLMAEKQEDHDFECRMSSADGRVVWIRNLVTVVVEGNRPVRLLGVMIDITERKEADEKLRELNERLVLLIERMPIACIYWTPEFTVDLWNPMAQLIFGYSEEEMLGNEPYGTIVPEPVRNDVAAIWQRLLSGDESAHSVNENHTRDGRTIMCEWSNTPVKGAAGETIGVISMVQDVSERIAAEYELEKYKSNLEELVEQRTVQLEYAQQKLLQKEKLAVLGQLTATVSHEIRNPLGTVANSIYLLKETVSGDENKSLQRPLELAERNVERCNTIISDLLDFSRQREVEKRPLDIDEWLEECLSETSTPQNVTIETDFSADCVVPADAERLRRVIVNVVTNAFQALEEIDREDKALSIATKVAGDRCLIVLSDNGPGMSRDVLEQIYEPMFSTKNFGVGLGVPIIRSIMENHGGDVDYQSQEGEGTTVTVSLPLQA